MANTHSPTKARKSPKFWDLVCKSCETSEMVWLNTKPLEYDVAKAVGTRMNEMRDLVGYGYKVTMEPADLE
jgi:hypothetical protein